MKQGDVRKAAELIRRIDALERLRRTLGDKSPMVLGIFAAVDEHEGSDMQSLAFVDVETGRGALDFAIGKLRAQLVDLGVGAD